LVAGGVVRVPKMLRDCCASVGSGRIVGVGAEETRAGDDMVTLITECVCLIKCYRRGRNVAEFVAIVASSDPTS
jgi:hypothetical protein